MRNGGGVITISDIASKVGVSKAAVSMPSTRPPGFLAKTEEPRNVVLSTELVVRESAKSRN